MIGTSNITTNDLRQLVSFAQAAPEYMSFTRACFSVARLCNVLPEQVIAACTTNDYTPEIVEALRTPTFSKVTLPKNGEDILF